MTLTATRSDPNFAFRPLKQPANLTSTLVARLREEITSGRLVPGVRLPTEQEMMASFAVSRTVVREAVAALKADGLVVTRQGSGAFVASDRGRRPFRIDPDQIDSIHDVIHLMELRASVELDAAGLAAERRQDENLRDIDDALYRIDQAIAQGDTAIAADFDFHRAIARATHNPYHMKFLEFLGNFTIPRQRIRVDVQTPEQQVAYLQRVQTEHHEIYAAIKAQDADAARESARRHCMNSRARYQKIAEAV